MMRAANIAILPATSIVLVLNALWSLGYASAKRDGLHWGSVLDYSMQICEGRAPFTEVPIYHGLVSLFTFCATGSLFEFSYPAMALVTHAFFAANLFVVVLIIRELGHSIFIQAAVAVTVLLIHPFIVLPWSDYFAGAFLSAGLYCLLRQRRVESLVPAMLAVVALSLATLARLSFLINSLTLLTLYIVLIQPQPRIIAAMLGTGLAVLALFFAGMSALYGISFMTAYESTLESVNAISGFQLLPIQSVMLFVSLMFEHPTYVGGPALFFIGLAAGAFTRLVNAKDDDPQIDSLNERYQVIVLGLGIVALLAQSHLVEFFRLYCATPVVLAFVFEPLDRISTALWHRSQARLARSLASVPAMCVSLTSVIVFWTYAINPTTPAYVREPALLAYNRGWDALGAMAGNGSFRQTIAGVTFYEAAQARFYTTVRQTCSDFQSLANLTEDALLARVCAREDNVIHDLVPENKARYERTSAEELNRARSLQAKPGEIIFAPEELVIGTPRSARILGTLSQEDEDWINGNVAMIGRTKSGD